MSTTLLATAALAGGAFAQPASQGQQTPPAQANNTLQELVVTGTRIPRPNLEQPTPVAVISPTVIQQAGPQDLGDIISQLPAVGPTNTIRANSNNFGNQAGVSSVDLRNLGTSRTLVLVDGQRHVAGDLGSNAVDLNSIPTALVDHVEVVTGGASAIYGSDAVSGVVNIILKKRFEGLQLDAQGGGYDGGFGQRYSASFTAGKTFLDDRLNLTFTGFWRNEAGVDARNLPKANNYGTIVNPADLKGPVDPTFRTSPSPIRGDGIPDRIWVPLVGSELVTENGAIFDTAHLPTLTTVVSFDAHGNPIPVPARTGFNSSAFGAFGNGCADCFFPEDFEQLISANKQGGGDLRANYDFSPHLHANLDAKFVQTNVSNTIQPSFTFGDFLILPDNAFITPAIRSALDTNVPGFESFNDLAILGEFLNGGRAQDIRRRTYRIVGGLNGDFDARFATINWDAALNYGRSENRFTNTGLRILANFDAAIDSVIDPATGQPACRINVPSAGPPQEANDETSAAPGCVPFNPFGPATNSAAAFAYSFGTFLTRDTLSQEDANLNINFDTSRFFNLQGGPIGVALGGEYRMERTKEVNDQALVSGLTENLSANSSGGYNVKEGYVELSLPIFKDFRPLIQELSLDAAYRVADYSTVGSVGAYKFSGTYGPVSWLKFRSTYSRAIRAPNITEAFLPPTPGFFNITDPCSVENIGSNINFAHNCAAAGIPAGFVASTNASITGQTSGNPNLDPEKSISYTAGIVFQPPVVPGLAITLDYYSIKIKDAISQVSAQDIINNCFGGANLDPTFCSLFTRGPDLNIDFVKTTFVNSSKLLTTGFELQANWAGNVAPITQNWRYTQGLDGRLSLDMTVDYVQKLRDFPFQTDPTNYHVLEGVVNNNGNEGTPHLRGLADATYKQGPVTFNWQVRYVGRGALFNRDPTSADGSEATNIPYAPARFYHDISLRYALDEHFGNWGRGAEVFAGVNNLFGEQDPFFLVGQGDDLAYDLGRFIYAGIKIRR